MVTDPLNVQVLRGPVGGKTVSQVAARLDLNDNQVRDIAAKHGYPNHDSMRRSLAVLEVVGLDPAPVHVGPVERAQVVEVELVAAADDQRVVARDRDVVEEDVGVGPAADRAVP